jgi:hypothetical protein
MKNLIENVSKEIPELKTFRDNQIKDLIVATRKAYKEITTYNLNEIDPIHIEIYLQKYCGLKRNKKLNNS